MSVKATVKYTQFIDLETAILEVEDKISAALSVIGSGTASRLAPVDTGNLSRSIGYSNKFNQTGTLVGRPKETAEAEWGTTTEYAPYVEFGTASPNRKAQPFMGPSKAAVSDALPRVGKKYGEDL
jgi:HK97 gp10 family phage protein